MFSFKKEMNIILIKQQKLNYFVHVCVHMSLDLTHTGVHVHRVPMDSRRWH